jgi:putative heme transporter
VPSAANDSPDGGSVRRDRDLPDQVWRLGRAAWGLLGLVGLVVLLGFVSSQLILVVVPVVLALFPATLLVPVAGWLKDRGVPAALASLVSILAGIGLIVGVIAVLIPAVASEAPELADSASEGIEELEELVADLGIGIESVDDLLDRVQEQVGDLGEYTEEALDAAVAAGETITGAILVMVILFFYLKDGRRLTRGLVATLPERHRSTATTIAEQAWTTLGAYFRGQMLVALVDAVFIGLGLWILGVPLALPLAVLVFFGGLFPIVGAVVTGMVAVLVALADGGLGPALIVFALVLVVQQLESNVLEPYILGRAINLHPLVILLSITAGSVTLGILGAFLAVPLAAVTARTIEILRDEDGEGRADDDGAQDPDAHASDDRRGASSRTPTG